MSTKKRSTDSDNIDARKQEKNSSKTKKSKTFYKNNDDNKCFVAQKKPTKRQWPYFGFRNDQHIKSTSSDTIRFPREFKPQGRNYTVSVAIPGSIIDNSQTTALKTYLAGQIARSLAIFSIDEVIIFNENKINSENTSIDLDGPIKGAQNDHSSIFLSRILMYLECPQYLRQNLFPIHPDLKFAGLLNPLDAPHHVRQTDDSYFREGVVIRVSEGKSSINIGLDKPVVLSKTLPLSSRVTLQLKQYDQNSLSSVPIPLHLVKSSLPRSQYGIYWGYQVRIAQGISGVFNNCPFSEGYDYIIGTSEHGLSIYDDNFVIPSFHHLLIVFGGLDGIEHSFLSDDDFKKRDPSKYFNIYVNTCEGQGSRTIRTEEAILISLSTLYPFILRNKI